MNPAVMSRLWALLAVAAGTLSLAAVAWQLAATRGATAPGVVVTTRARLWLTWLVATTATAGSLYFSEVAGFIPCQLCWYQRIAMYPLSLVLAIAALRDDLDVRRYVLPVAGIGAGISIYHYLLQWFPQLETTTCDPAAPCAAFYVREFGFVSIPFMALMGFLTIIVGLALPRPTGAR